MQLGVLDPVHKGAAQARPTSAFSKQDWARSRGNLLVGEVYAGAHVKSESPVHVQMRPEQRDLRQESEVSVPSPAPLPATSVARSASAASTSPWSTSTRPFSEAPARMVSTWSANSAVVTAITAP